MNLKNFFSLSKSVNLKVSGIIILCILLLTGSFAVPENLGISEVKAALIPGEDELFFTILHTNDEHSSLIPHSPAIDFHPELDNPTKGGFARLATAVNNIRREKAANGEEVLLFSGGDFLGGPAFGWLAPLGYAPELAVMQAIGYDAVTIGNHEYDYGPDVLASYLKTAGYPQAQEITKVLASNTVPPADHPLNELDMLRSTHIFELDNGLKVGTFGLIGKAAVMFCEANASPVEFSDQIEAAQKAVDELKAKGADVIVAITHAGMSELNQEDKELAREVPEIDVIVGGHSHTALHKPLIEGKTIIVQTKNKIPFFGMLELAYDQNTGEVRLRNEETGQPYLVPLDNSFPLDPEINEMIEEITSNLNQEISRMTGGMFEDIMEVIAYSDFDLPMDTPLAETGFANLVSDALRIITSEVIGEEVAVSVYANGNIRGDLTTGTMDHSKGLISFYDLTELVGLGYGSDGEAGYPVVSFFLTGNEIRKILEVAALLSDIYGDQFFLQFSGLRYSYAPHNAVLFNLPIVDLPVPTTRAVTSAGLYTGSGIQTLDDNDYTAIERGDETLYRVVTDSYILSYLPMIGDMLPMLNVIPKDADGYPLPELDDAIVYQSAGLELKAWQAIAEYTASLEIGETGYPEIPVYYKEAMGRINKVNAFPLIIIPIGLLVLLVALITWLISRRRKKKRKGYYPYS